MGLQRVRHDLVTEQQQQGNMTVQMPPESQWPDTGAVIFQSLRVPISDLVSCWLLAQMVKDLPTTQGTQV